MSYEPIEQSHNRWAVVAAAVVGLSVSIGTVVVYTFGVFMKPLIQEFHWNRGEVSLALSLTNLMVTLGSPGVGWLGDRAGGRAVILPSIALFSLGLISFFFLTPHLWHLYLLYSFAGLAGLGATSLTYSRVVASWFDERRGLALGITTSGIGLGSFVMPSLAQWMITAAGWRFAYVALGLITLLVPLPVVALWLREKPHTRRVAAARESTRSEALRTRAFWQMMALFLCISGCVNGTVAHLPALLTDRGVSPQAAAFAISLFGGAAVAGRILTGYLVDRFFAPYVIAVLFAGVTLALLVLASGLGGFAGYGAAVLLGIGIGAEADVMPYLVSRYFGLGSLGELFGYMFSAYTLGVAVGPYLMGTGFDATGSYRLPLTGFVIAMTAAIAATVSLPKYAR